MALVYEYPSKVLTNTALITSSEPAVRKAILKAKCTEEHADAFFAALKAQWGTIRPMVQAIGDAAVDKLKGKDVLANLVLKKHTILAKVFTKTVVGPQFVFQTASFDLSVHLKGDSLQLWMSYKGGGTLTLLDVKKPA